MSGNKEGAKKAIQTKIQRYGSTVFSKNGKKGGKARNASQRRYTPFVDAEFAREMGRKGADKRWAKKQAEPEGKRD